MSRAVQEEIDKGKHERCEEIKENLNLLRHERAVLSYEYRHHQSLKLTEREVGETREQIEAINEDIQEKTRDYLALAFGDNREAAARFKILRRIQWQEYEAKNQDLFKGDANFRRILHLKCKAEYRELKKQVFRYPRPGFDRKDYKPWEERREQARKRSRELFDQLNNQSFNQGLCCSPFPCELPLSQSSFADEARCRKSVAPGRIPVPETPASLSPRKEPPQNLKFELKRPKERPPTSTSSRLGTRKTRGNPRVREKERKQREIQAAKQDRQAEASAVVSKQIQRGDTTSCDPLLEHPRPESKPQSKGKERAEDLEKKVSVTGLQGWG